MDVTPNYNKVILIGHLGQDPEIKQTKNRKEIALFSLATTKKWKQEGEEREQTEWHKILINSPSTINFVRRYLKKGMAIMVEGELTYQKYETKNGDNAYSTTINVSPFNGNLQIIGDAKNNNSSSTKDDDDTKFSFGNPEDKKEEEEEDNIPW